MSSHFHPHSFLTHSAPTDRNEHGQSITLHFPLLFLSPLSLLLFCFLCQNSVALLFSSLSKTKVFLFFFFLFNCKGKTKIIKSKETPYTPLSFNASQYCQNLFYSNVIFPHHGKMATVHSTPCNTINADHV